MNAIQNYNVNDVEARTSSKLFNVIVERMESADENEKFTP